MYNQTLLIMPRKYRKKGKKVVNAKKTEYKGIKFQSYLELFAYKSLEEADISVDYEKHTFTVFEPMVYPQACYEGTTKKLYNKGSKIRAITYTPDFVDPNGKWIMETKGHANESFPLRWKLFKKHLKDKDLQYVIFMPRNKAQVTECIDLIKQL
tara:strand:+ start:589 stop:1050 length:462 start_codon:yes stop_codon:yes gene_type:complete